MFFGGFVGSVCYPSRACFHSTERIHSAFVGVFWDSVNMTLIFHNILNPMAKMFVGVYLRLSVHCELAFISVYLL